MDLLWVDPARDLVLRSHWTEHPGDVLRHLSGVVPEQTPDGVREPRRPGAG